ESPEAGAALAVLAALMAGSSEMLIRFGRRLDGIYHVLAAAALALVGLVLVDRHGVGVPQRGAMVFGLCGVGTLIVNARWRFPAMTYAGAIAVLGGLAHFLVWYN